MKLAHLAFISLIVTIGIFLISYNKEIKNKSKFDLSKPIKKSILENEIEQIIQDSFKLELDEEIKKPIYKESSQFYFKDVRAIQDTLNQKVVVNFQLYKPLYDGTNEMITFVMITFLKNEIDIVEWSYSEHFVESSEFLFETEKINSSYIKQK